MTAIPLTHDTNEKLWDWPLSQNDGIVKVKNTAEKFEVGLDAQFFTPNEIEVKVINQEVVIHCRHEKRNDEFGFVTREIHRAYQLPADVDASTIKSHLTARGTLFITASKKH